MSYKEAYKVMLLVVREVQSWVSIKWTLLRNLIIRNAY